MLLLNNKIKTLILSWFASQAFIIVLALYLNRNLWFLSIALNIKPVITANYLTTENYLGFRV
jgi:hypothetical protein